jgi:hypothetical protein
MCICKSKIKFFYLNILGYLHIMASKQFQSSEQTPESCRQAILNSPYNLKFVREQTPELCELAFNKARTVHIFKAARFQSLDMCRLMVQRKIAYAQYIKEFTLDVCLMLARMKISALNYVTKISPDDLATLLTMHPAAYEFILCKNHELDAVAVEIEPSNIAYVSEQTDDLCIAALNVKIGIKSLIMRPSQDVVEHYLNIGGEDLKWLANVASDAHEFVENCPIEAYYPWNDANALLIAKKSVLGVADIVAILPNDTDEAEILALLDINVACFSYLANVTTVIAMHAVNINGKYLQYVDTEISGYEDICVAAILNDPMSYKYVWPKTKKITKLAIKQDLAVLRHVPKKLYTDKIYQLIANELAEADVIVSTQILACIPNPPEYLSDAIIQISARAFFRTRAPTVKQAVIAAAEIDLSRMIITTNELIEAFVAHGKIYDFHNYIRSLDQLIHVYRVINDEKKFNSEIRPRVKSAILYRFDMMSQAQKMGTNAKSAAN